MHSSSLGNRAFSSNPRARELSAWKRLMVASRFRLLASRRAQKAIAFFFSKLPGLAGIKGTFSAPI